LLLLAGQDYTVDQLVGVVGRDRMIQSSVWQAALAEGEAKGKAEGEVTALKDACLELVRKHHPAMLPKATPIVEGCDDPGLLKDWLLAASDPDEVALARRLGLS
jgi:hypothetical protein